MKIAPSKWFKFNLHWQTLFQKSWQWQWLTMYFSWGSSTIDRIPWISSAKFATLQWNPQVKCHPSCRCLQRRWTGPPKTPFRPPPLPFSPSQQPYQPWLIIPIPAMAPQHPIPISPPGAAWRTAQRPRSSAPPWPASPARAQRAPVPPPSGSPASEWRQRQRKDVINNGDHLISQGVS